MTVLNKYSPIFKDFLQAVSIFAAAVAVAMAGIPGRWLDGRAAGAPATAAAAKRKKNLWWPSVGKTGFELVLNPGPTRLQPVSKQFQTHLRTRLHPVSNLSRICPKNIFFKVFNQRLS